MPPSRQARHQRSTDRTLTRRSFAITAGLSTRHEPLADPKPDPLQDATGPDEPNGGDNLVIAPLHSARCRRPNWWR